MPTGLTLNAGTGGSDLATDSVGGFVYQYTKHAFGGDGTATLVTTANRFPVACSGAVVWPVQEDGPALTALQLMDDPVVTLGTDTYSEATTKGFVISAVRNDTLAALANTDNEMAPLQVNATGALYVDGSDVTQPVSAASLPLPSGAATAANQLPDGHNVTIDNASGASAVNIQDGGNSITVDGTVTANAGTGDFLSVAAHTVNEALKEATAIGGQLDDTGTTAATENNVAPVRITAQRAIHANLRNNAGTELGTSGAPVRTDPTGTTTQPVSVSSIAAGANLIGNVGVGVRTSGGSTPYQNLDVDETEDAVKATAGQVYWIHAMNLAATKRYLKFYNATVATVVVGTTTPVLTLPLPTQGDTNGAGFTLSIPNGIAFSTAITIAATTGFAVADTGAPGANEVIVNIGYA